MIDVSECHYHHKSSSFMPLWNHIIVVDHLFIFLGGQVISNICNKW